MSDPTLSPAPGGQAQTSGQAPAPVVTTSEAPFFEYAWEDGKKDSFKTKEDFSKVYRDGVLRYSDYTKKTQELAKQRDDHARKEREFQASAEKILSLQKKYDPMDDFIRKRPDIEKYILDNMRGPSNDAQEAQFKALMEQYVKPLQDELGESKKWRQEKETAEKQSQLFSHFKTQYPDFNEEAIKTRQKEFNELPEGEEDRAFIELLYLAEKGRNPTASEAVIEAKVADKLAKKIGRTSPVPSTNAAPSNGEEIPAHVRSSADPIKAAAEHYKRTHATA